MAVVGWLHSRGKLVQTPCAALRYFASPATACPAKAPLTLSALVGVLAREKLEPPDWLAPHLAGVSPSYPEALEPKKPERRVRRAPDDERSAGPVRLGGLAAALIQRRVT